MMKLTIDTIVGPRKIDAPDGWNYDDVSAIVWSKLLEQTRRGFEPFKLQRDRYHWAGKIEALANILSSSLGMAGYFWENAALEQIIKERAP